MLFQLKTHGDLPNFFQYMVIAATFTLHAAHNIVWIYFCEFIPKWKVQVNQEKYMHAGILYN